MIVLMTLPAVPGMFVARSNVLCMAYLPVASSGFFWLPPPVLPSPVPSSSPAMDGSAALQPAAVVPSARARARARLFVVFMVIFSGEDCCRASVQRMCHGSRPRDQSDLAQLNGRLADRL